MIVTQQTMVRAYPLLEKVMIKVMIKGKGMIQLRLYGQESELDLPTKSSMRILMTLDLQEALEEDARQVMPSRKPTLLLEICEADRLQVVLEVLPDCISNLRSLKI